jgi:uncharacterized lipoprotein YmbA
MSAPRHPVGAAAAVAKLAVVRKLAAVAAVAVLLASCRSAPTRLFTLDAIASKASAGGYAGPSIRVDAIKVPPAWDRLELLQATGRGEWRIDDFDHWAAPLGQLMREALTTDLASRLPPDRVIFPSLPKPPGALGLRIDMLDFRAGASGARLEASWIVTPALGSVPATATPHSIVLEATAPADGAAATARALAELLARLADAVVAQLNADSSASQGSR